jgi:nicotinamide-nucleotide amidase
LHKDVALSQILILMQNYRGIRANCKKSLESIILTVQHINAEIVAIGTELLLGEITDTNSVFIARTLRDLGINLYFKTTVGDNLGRIESALRLALGRAQVVITCGGLGPTVDDMTREGVAAATDRGLTFHQTLLDSIAARFASFRAQMTDNNRRQAYVPDGAVIIENPVGTAPSFAVEVDDSVIISLPGVPREMKYLLIERVVPYLRQKYKIGGTIIKARTLKTAGLGESMLDDLLGQELLNSVNPSIGLAAHSGVVDVRITAKAETEAEADAMNAVIEAQVRARVGEYIFGVDGVTIEGALLEVVRAHGAGIAVDQTSIAPVISERILTAGGADVLRAVTSAATIDERAAALGLASGAPLRQIAEQAAEAAARAAGVTVGIALISRTDTADDTADQDEVSAVAVWVNGKLRSRAYGFGGGSDFARSWTGTWAMSGAWRMLGEGA